MTKSNAISESAILLNRIIRSERNEDGVWILVCNKPVRGLSLDGSCSDAEICVEGEWISLKQEDQQALAEEIELLNQIVVLRANLAPVYPGYDTLLAKKASWKKEHELYSKELDAERGPLDDKISARQQELQDEVKRLNNQIDLECEAIEQQRSDLQERRSELQSEKIDLNSKKLDFNSDARSLNWDIRSATEEGNHELVAELEKQQKAYYEKANDAVARQGAIEIERDNLEREREALSEKKSKHYSTKLSWNGLYDTDEMLAGLLAEQKALEAARSKASSAEFPEQLALLRLQAQMLEQFYAIEKCYNRLTIQVFSGDCFGYADELYPRQEFWVDKLDSNGFTFHVKQGRLTCPAPIAINDEQYSFISEVKVLHKYDAMYMQGTFLLYNEQGGFMLS